MLVKVGEGSKSGVKGRGRVKVVGQGWGRVRIKVRGSREGVMVGGGVLGLESGGQLGLVEGGLR